MTSLQMKCYFLCDSGIQNKIKNLLLLCPKKGNIIKELVFASIQNDTARHAVNYKTFINRQRTSSAVM